MGVAWYNFEKDYIKLIKKGVIMSQQKYPHVLLPETATAEEIGEAIFDMFDELEKMGVKKLYR